jgi:hypothetical protein
MLQPQPEDAPSPSAIEEAIGTAYRRQLLLLNRERIEFNYVNAVAKGVEDPVIVVLDLQDDGAAHVAHATGVPWAQILQWRADCAEDDVAPTQVLAAPRWAILSVIGPMTPNSPQGVMKPSPPETFRVVAVAHNGNAFADFPLPPGSNIGD